MIREKLDSLIANAMTDGQKYKLKVLRLIKSEYQKFETSGKNKVLDDAEEIKILKKMQKQWKEELEAFIEARRDTFNLTLELKYLESFLPKEMSDTEQHEAAKKVITKYLIGFPIEERSSMKHVGAIMKIIHKEFPMIDGKIVLEEFKNITT